MQDLIIKDINSLKQEIVVFEETSFDNSECETLNCDEVFVNIENLNEKQIVKQEEKEFDEVNKSTKKCVHLMVHSCQCKEVLCDRDTCAKMKKVIQHTMNCKKRQMKDEKCLVCKQMITLCYYHSKQCNLYQCPVY